MQRPDYSQKMNRGQSIEPSKRFPWAPKTFYHGLVNSKLRVWVMGAAVSLLAGGCAEPPPEPYQPAFDETSFEVERCSLEPIDRVSVQWFVMVGDEAWLTAGWGGGCERHDFKLCWDGAFDESGPTPEATLHLVHEGNQDLCEGGTSELMVFDATRLTDAWRADSQDPLLVRLKPFVPELPVEPVLTSTFEPEATRRIACDPVEQACSHPNQACWAFKTLEHTGLGCATTDGRSSEFGATCDYRFLCSPGLYCEDDPILRPCTDPANDPRTGCCNAFCRLDEPNDPSCPEGFECVASPEFAEAPSLGVCRPRKPPPD